LLLGCSAEGPEPNDALFAHHYFDALAGVPLAECSPTSRPALAGAALDLSLFFGAGRDDEAVVAQGSRLQRFFEPHGLELRAHRRASPTSLAYAMSGTAAQLDAAFTQLGLTHDGPLTDDEVRAASLAIGAIIFADLREFVESHAVEHSINMVVLEHILSPALSQYLFGTDGAEIIGFTVSPALFGQVDASDPEADLWHMTGLPDDFTPTMFMGDADIGDLPGSADNLVSHELGHALGLSHTHDPDNVMTPGQNRPCNEGLSLPQLAEMRRRLGHEGPGPHETPPVAAALVVDILPRVLDAALRARPGARGAAGSSPPVRAR
jgi:hypothetical protein